LHVYRKILQNLYSIFNIYKDLHIVIGMVKIAGMCDLTVKLIYAECTVPFIECVYVSL